MFEQLLGSKTRFHLLQLFINHPESYYFVRQLTRLLNTQINSVRRELMNLEEIGLVKSYHAIPVETGLVKNDPKDHQSSQKKFFKLNTEYFLYPELKALFLKEQMLSEKDFVKNLRKIGHINYLVLTGLFVGLEEEIKTDMFIVGTVDRDKLKKIIADYEKIFNKEINYSIFSYKEYKYRLSINDRFLYSILKNKKIVAIDELHEDVPMSAEQVLRPGKPIIESVIF